MIRIQIQNLSKSFSSKSIFQNLQFQLEQGNHLVISGPNGAGKSTFLKVFSGKMKPDTGTIQLIKNKKIVPQDFFFQNIAWDGPYIDVYPYFNLQETFYWHYQFFLPVFSFQEWIKILDLKPYQNTEIKYLSSGTLQRVKVGLALFSQTPILMLDEPTANMDIDNSHKILQLIRYYSENRILLIASNLLRETEWLNPKDSESYSSDLLTFHLYK